ncbi:unnamed protein product [Mycena citricolor]|uniref:Uncharacterized protein n=1 Tax=Mycena citricolor TaxID=2018698 RepID=A0AAD2HND3_9AGAR|nr:unnamed protein product [Mycena citricolor]
MLVRYIHSDRRSRSSERPVRCSSRTTGWQETESRTISIALRKTPRRLTLGSPLLDMLCPGMSFRPRPQFQDHPRNLFLRTQTLSLDRFLLNARQPAVRAWILLHKRCRRRLRAAATDA